MKYSFFPLTARARPWWRVLRPLALLLALLPLTRLAYAQTPIPQGAFLPDQLQKGISITHATAVNAAGDVFITGEFTGEMVFASANFFQLNSVGESDLFLAKWNTAASKWTWAVRAGGTGNDRGTGLAVVGTSIYLTGAMTNDLTNSQNVLLGGAMLQGASNNVSADLFVAKFADGSSNPTRTWAVTGGGTYDDEGLGIAVNGPNVYVTGYYADTYTNDNNAQFGGVALPGFSTNGSLEMLLVKYTDAGSSATYSWAVGGGGYGEDRGSAIAVNGTSVYVAGTYTPNQQEEFGGILRDSLNTQVARNTDGFVTKYTDAGSSPTYRWFEVVGGTEADRALGIALHGPDLYVTGFFSSDAANSQQVQIAGVALAGRLVLPFQRSEAFLAKYTDAGGSVSGKWAIAERGNEDEVGNGVAVDWPNIYVTGTFTNDKANSQNLFFNGMAVPGVSTNSGQDVFVAKYTDSNSAPTRNWIKTGGGSGLDGLPYDQNVGIVASNNLVHVGLTMGDGASGFGSLPTRFLPGNAALLININAAVFGGTILSHGATLSGGTAQIEGTATNAAGDVFVTGSFTGTIFFNGVVLFNAGSEHDIFVAKWKRSSNNWVWATAAGGTTDDRGLGIAVRGTDVYVTGFFTNDAANRNEVSFWGGGQQRAGASSVISKDAFLARYTDHATYVTLNWAIVGGGTAEDQGNGIAVNGTSLYLTGSTTNDAANSQQVQFGGVALPGASSYSTQDVFVAKYLDGLYQPARAWTMMGGGDSNDQGKGIAVNGTSVYATGTVNNNAANDQNVSFSGVALPGNDSIHFAGNDAFVVKYTDNGLTATHRWAVVGGGDSDDQGAGIAVNGPSVYVTGTITNDAANTQRVRFGTTPLAGASNFGASQDAFVTKYTDNGSTVANRWAVAGGGSADDASKGIAVSGTGVYITGSITNDLADNQEVKFGSVPLAGASSGTSQDLFVARYTDLGTAAAYSWAVAEGGDYEEVGTSIAASGNQIAIGGSISIYDRNIGITMPYQGFGLTLFDPVPVLTSLSPTSGSPGIAVTLTGTNFASPNALTPVGATTVRFNGVPATNLVLLSATQIRVTVPAGATTGLVTVATAKGGASNGLLFTVVPPDLIVASAQTVAGGTYNAVLVTNTGTLTLTAPLTVNNALVVQTDGVLIDNCQLITGAGALTVEPGATLRICNPLGIAATGENTGAIRVTGARAFSLDASYAYQGPGGQQTGSGMRGARELVIANPAGVVLNYAASVYQVLRLNAGTLGTNGQLTLISNQTQTAYAVHAGGTTSGTVAVQRYLGGTTRVGYRQLSSPVQAAPVSDLATSGFTPKVNAAYNALPAPALPAASFPTVFGYNETRGGTTPAYAGFGTGYESPASLATVLTPGRGYSVYLPGGKTPDFVGQLTTGDVPMNLSVTGTNASPNTEKAGWHLLGNPYPQPIDWDLATVPTGMSASISVFRTSGGNNGQYLLRANGVGSLPDGILPLGQAFFARATAATTFTFSNALRVENSTATVARPTADLRPQVALTLTSAAGEHDAAYVYFEAGATAGLDARFDGQRPGLNLGTVPTLSTLTSTGEAVAINGLPETALATGTALELALHLPTAGSYELAAAELTNLSGTAVELLDRFTGTRYDLTTTPVVQFTATTAGGLSGRFALNVGQRVLGTAAAAAAPTALAVYPNPASVGGGLVRVTGGVVGTSVTVLDLAGRRVAVAVADASGAAAVRTQGLASGVYVVRAADGRTTRLVVE